MLEVRALLERDDRSTFRSGDPDLDRFFQQFAGQNQFKPHLGVSYVAVDDGRILGFATVAAAHLEIENLPDGLRRKLPDHPLPVLRLARLAIDQSAQGQGLGIQLLRFVLGLKLEMANDYGCVGIVVDAKLGAVPFYAQYGVISIDVLAGLSDARPAPIAMFLSIRAVAGALASD